MFVFPFINFNLAFSNISFLFFAKSKIHVNVNECKCIRMATYVTRSLSKFSAACERFNTARIISCSFSAMACCSTVGCAMPRARPPLAVTPTDAPRADQPVPNLKHTCTLTKISHRNVGMATHLARSASSRSLGGSA